MRTAFLLVGLLLALPAHAAVDPHALALDGVCAGTKPVEAFTWRLGADRDGPVVVLEPRCDALPPAAYPLIFGTSLRSPRWR